MDEKRRQEPGRISRREMLKMIGVGAAGAVLAPSFAPVARAIPRLQAEEIVLNIDFRGYGPDPTGANPEQGKALAALLAQYKELFPNVTVNHTPVDYQGMDSQQWTERRLVAKDGPDLLFGNWTYLIEKWMEAGLVGFWDPYLEMPNPYVEGVEHWRDQFIMPSAKQSNGMTAWLGLDNTTLWSFYNKTMFEEMGLTPPTTWPEQIALYEAIKANGVIPFADYHSLAYAVWTFDPVANQIMFDLFEEIAEGQEAEPIAIQVARAVVDGRYNVDSPEYQDSFRIASDWWKYAPEGAFSGGDDQGYQLFLSGKAATRFGGVWENASLHKDMPTAENPFEWSAFPIPIIPKDMSQFATEKQTAAVFIAGFLLFTVPAYNSGAKLDQTADLLMFLSVPENLGSLLNEYKGLVPNIKNVPLPASLEGFRVAEDATFWYVNSWGATHVNVEVRDAWVRNWQLVLLGQMTIEDYTATMKPLMEKAAQEEIERVG